MAINKKSFNLLCGVAIVFLFEPSFAQIKIGLKAGGNLYDTYQTGNKYFISQPHAGFHAGLYGDYLFTEKLFGRAEALFSTRGLYLSRYSNGDRIDYEREASYIDFPITANYAIWKTLSIHAGFVPSLFVNEYRSVTKDANGYKVSGGDQFASYERWQLGILAGASYEFSLFRKNFEAGARYIMAFTRTNELIRDVRASHDPKYMMVQAYIALPIFYPN